MAKLWKFGKGVAAVVFAAALTACSSNSTAPAPGTTARAADALSAGASAGCDQAIMVNIAGAAYDRKDVDLNMGDTLLVMNKTMETYTLEVAPDDGLRYMVLDPMEMEHVPFDKAGTYLLTSREHPETSLQVKVSTKPNYTCGEKPVTTVEVGANGAFSQPNVNVPQGQSILVVNKTGQTLDVASTPSLGMGMGDQVYHAGEQQTLYFPDAQTYVFSSKQFPGQKLTVVVGKGTGDSN